MKINLSTLINLINLKFGFGNFLEIRIIRAIRIILFILLFFAASPALASTINSSLINSLTSGLVGYWTMDAKDITWKNNKMIDKSGNNNIGQLIGMSTTTSAVAGKIGQGMKFDGTSSYIDLGSLGSFGSSRGNNITISAWVKPDNNSSAMTVLGVYNNSSSKNGLRITINTDKNFAFLAGGIATRLTSNEDTIKMLQAGTAVGGSNWVHAGRWTHISVVIVPSSNTIIIYADGVSKTISYVYQATPAIFGNFTSYSVALGALNNTGTISSYFSGLLDDVRIYNRALSPSEIKELYNQGASSKQNVSPVNSLLNGLVGYWTFDGKDTKWSSATAGVTADKSGNGNTGTFTNMNRATAPVAGKIGQAMRSNGINSLNYISIGNPTAIYTSSGTICAWVKTGVDSDSPILQAAVGNANFWVSVGNGVTGTMTNELVTISLYDTNEIAVNRVGYTTATRTELIDNKWHQVCASSNGSSYAIYIDAVSKTLTVGVGANDGKWLNSYAFTSARIIGRDPEVNSRLDGSIDDVRVYNRALTPSEIKRLYNIGR